MSARWHVTDPRIGTVRVTIARRRQAGSISIQSSP
jgi:hypothetical protein